MRLRGRIRRSTPFALLAAEQAVEAARAAEQDAVMRGRALGPPHGVPIGIKDVTPTAGIRTTYGSPLYAEHVPTEDAEVVTRLKAAGVIVLGKTNTPEFATGANTVNKVFGATRNPWDLSLTAGGSTGGGAAAVAARMLPLAEGTDVVAASECPRRTAASSACVRLQDWCRTRRSPCLGIRPACMGRSHAAPAMWG